MRRRNRDKSLIKHECLRFEELPKPGTLVAIDAEFVSMQQVGSHSTRLVHLLTCIFISQEETEFRSDGTNRVIRPARLSLARVSVLRGDGPKASIPFIDDHIHTSEVIVDYLTEFSGIKCTLLLVFPPCHLLEPIGTVSSRRLGSALVKVHVDAAEACVQEITIARRSRVHIYRSRALQGFSDYQSVHSLFVTFQGSL